MRVRHGRAIAMAAALAVFAGGVLIAQTPGFIGVKMLSNGNFGINTTTPERPLHVVGDALVTGQIRGSYANGRYSDAAVIHGHSASQQSETPFVIVYNDSSPTRPPSIMLVNAATNVFKNFIIPHPSDPERYLVHATLEGPEGAVYYRGSARLNRGRAEIRLPPYFERLTRPGDRTVLLTAVDGFDPLSVISQRGEKIREGRFVVESSRRDSRQAFDWEVKAVRADAPPLRPEPLRRDIVVGGIGPYTFVAASR